MTCSRWRRLATALSPPGRPGSLAASTSISHRGISSSTSQWNKFPSSWPQLKRKDSTKDLDKQSFMANGDGLKFGTPFTKGQLTRRKPVARDPAPSNSSNHADSPVPDATPIVAKDEPPPFLISKSDRSRTMLIVSGLSSSLKASDFQRLVPNDLSSWNVLKQVQQKRCPKTYEPLGIYYLTFTSPVARGVYHDKLLRLHGLNKHKLRFADELLRDDWINSVPLELRAGGSGDLAADAETFTLAPGSLRIPAPVSKRAGVPNNWWAKTLGVRLQKFGLGTSPPSVLLHLHPPTLTAKQLAQAIEEDGSRRGYSWKVFEPLPLDEDNKENIDQSADQGPGLGVHGELDLDMTQATAPDTDAKPSSGEPSSPDDGELQEELQGKLEGELGDEPDPTDEEPTERAKARPLINYGIQVMQKSRFVIVCADEPEAQRFYRHWNQKILAVSEHHRNEQNLVHASRINW